MLHNWGVRKMKSSAGILKVFHTGRKVDVIGHPELPNTKNPLLSGGILCSMKFTLHVNLNALSKRRWIYQEVCFWHPQQRVNIATIGTGFGLAVNKKL